MSEQLQQDVEPKFSFGHRALQWLALIPAIFSLRVRHWLLNSLQADRKLRLDYQRYLNRKQWRKNA
jgi:hypothetical protein